MTAPQIVRTLLTTSIPRFAQITPALSTPNALLAESNISVIGMNLVMEATFQRWMEGHADTDDDHLRQTGNRSSIVGVNVHA